jgi:hypothetical protein
VGSLCCCCKWSHVGIGYPIFLCIRNLKILHSQPFAAAYILMETKQDSRKPVLLMTLEIMLLAEL